MTVPHVLLPYQQAWWNDTSRVRWAEKSRRVGWSWNVAAECALEASMKNGCDSWYVGYNKEMAQEFIRDCAWWAKHYGEAVGAMEESVFEDDDPDKNILIFSIKFASGWRITALSSRPTNLRNKRGHIIIDEAAHHPDLAGLLKSAFAVFMWGGRSRVDVISTHNGVDNYFNEMIEETRAGKRPYSLHRCTLTDALKAGLFKRICLVNGWAWTQELENQWRDDLYAQYGDAAAEELDCVPAKSGGTYLPRMLIERQMRPGHVLRFAPPEDFLTWTESAREGHVSQWLDEEVGPLLRKVDAHLMHFFGEDFGRVSDRTVINVGELGQDLVRRFRLSLELSNTPFDQQKQVLFYVVDRLPRFIGGALDATGNGAYLAEAALLKYGEKYIQRVDMTDSWYRENLPKLKAALNDETCELIRDADHLIDLGHFKVIDGVPKLPKWKTKAVSKEKGQGKLRHGDAAVAYATGYFASALPLTDYGYQSAPKHATKRDLKVVSGFKARRGGGVL